MSDTPIFEDVLASLAAGHRTPPRDPDLAEPVEGQEDLLELLEEDAR